MTGRPRIDRGVHREFWVLIAAGWSTEAAAVAVGVSVTTGRKWFTDAGGMAPLSLLEPSGRYLSFAEREDISAWREAGVGVREMARRLGRAPSTVSRELTERTAARRPRTYRASTAQAHADAVARRPKPRRLAGNDRLRSYVQDHLSGPSRWSPEQISARLRVDFPDDESMRISHEAIYQALYVQGRGELRRDLHRCLRTGRALRRPRAQAGTRSRRGETRIKDKVMISERPADVADRAVPGNWEGDLIVGKDSGSAIGTLVERTTRFVMLLHLPDDHGAVAVRDQIITAIAGLPTALARSLTWDQGIELARHADITLATGCDIYFCDPHSPWQRGSNENTNGLLRQYFPKATDLGQHTAEDLRTVAHALNNRPRKTLSWATPTEALTRLLCEPPTERVATTP